MAAIWAALSDGTMLVGSTLPELPFMLPLVLELPLPHAPRTKVSASKAEVASLCMGTPCRLSLAFFLSLDVVALRGMLGVVRGLSLRARLCAWERCVCKRMVGQPTQRSRWARGYAACLGDRR